jgi:hypothetical protein
MRWTTIAPMQGSLLCWDLRRGNPLRPRNRHRNDKARHFSCNRVGSGFKDSLPALPLTQYITFFLSFSVGFTPLRRKQLDVGGAQRPETQPRALAACSKTPAKMARLADRVRHTNQRGARLAVPPTLNSHGLPPQFQAQLNVARTSGPKHGVRSKSVRGGAATRESCAGRRVVVRTPTGAVWIGERNMV